ncbi:phosphopantetheine-binding protein, partial [Streptomyces flavofungini]|uniref:phosphopantetheine-binding protein n=1 Tax=Streptomyces flavofungini TaxID=68200 RepID=UPI0034E02BDA
ARPAALTEDQRRAARLMVDVLARAARPDGPLESPSAGTEPGENPVTPAEDEAPLPGPDADFFALGGHSLLAVRIVAEAERRYGARVPLRALLADPTVAGLARALEAGTGAATGREAPFDPDAEHTAAPVQQRLWSLDRMRNVRTAYLAPGVVEIHGPVDAPALREAFARALARHPALRSRFRLDTKARRVLYRTNGPAPEVTLTDAAAWSAQRREDHLADLCWRPFDL